MLLLLLVTTAIAATTFGFPQVGPPVTLQTAQAMGKRDDVTRSRQPTRERAFRKKTALKRRYGGGGIGDKKKTQCPPPSYKEPPKRRDKNELI